MAGKRKRHSAPFKARVALEALKGMKNSQELAREYEVHPTQIAQWKAQLRDHAEQVFDSGAAAKQHEHQQAELSRADEQIGRLNLELDWLKKNRSARTSELRCLIEPGHPRLSIARQCELLGLPRSSYYYQPVPVGAEEAALMRRIEQQYLRTPWYGSRQMTAALRRQYGVVNRKRVQRLMRKMGLQAVTPGPHTSRKQPQHPVYPYLLRDYPPARPDDAWSTDITFVPMPIGFLYRVAIIDWYSRFVLAWQLSNTLETAFCLDALEQALARFGLPAMFNSDQGCPFTSEAFTGRLPQADIAISMDGRGRALDNVFVERLWRSVKYESIYLNEFANPPELVHGLDEYFTDFNYYRPNQGLSAYAPAEVYRLAEPPVFGRRTVAMVYL